MPFDWFPGHMKKARQSMADAIGSSDVLLEVLDARMPAASSNPLLADLGGDKPRIKVLSKSDCADAQVTAAWVNALSRAASRGPLVALALSRDRPAEARARIFELAQNLAPKRSGSNSPVRLMVVGIPNVGKSTLINTLMERKVARVSDEPAVTKSEQIITLKNGMTLRDNAGILWPRMDEGATLRLALGGALPDSAIDYESVGLFAAELLLARYPSLLCQRFKLDPALASPIEVLEAIGRKHGCLRSGGSVHLHKAADLLVHAFRTGSIGRISLEAPNDPSASADA